MSGFTQTTNELLYSYYAASTTSTPTANPGTSMIVGYPPIIIPANYFTNVGSRSSSLKLEMGGLCSVTAVAWQFFLYVLPLTTAAPLYGTTNTSGFFRLIHPRADRDKLHLERHRPHRDQDSGAGYCQYDCRGRHRIRRMRSCLLRFLRLYLRLSGCLHRVRIPRSRRMTPVRRGSSGRGWVLLRVRLLIP